MAQPIEITNDMRRALEEFGPDSKVFEQWSKIHRDFKGTMDGQRMTMQLSKGATILTRWHGPKVLAALTTEAAS